MTEEVIPTTIKVLRSHVEGRRPTDGSEGELWVNYPDQRLGIIDAQGQPVSLTGSKALEHTDGWNHEGAPGSTVFYVDDATWKDPVTGHTDLRHNNDAGPVSAIYERLDPSVESSLWIDINGKVNIRNGPTNHAQANFASLGYITRVYLSRDEGATFEGFDPSNETESPFYNHGSWCGQAVGIEDAYDAALELPFQNFHQEYAQTHIMQLPIGVTHFRIVGICFFIVGRDSNSSWLGECNAEFTEIALGGMEIVGK